MSYDNLTILPDFVMKIKKTTMDCTARKMHVNEVLHRFYLHFYFLHILICYDILSLT